MQNLLLPKLSVNRFYYIKEFTEKIDYCILKNYICLWANQRLNTSVFSLISFITQLCLGNLKTTWKCWRTRKKKHKAKITLYTVMMHCDYRNFSHQYNQGIQISWFEITIYIMTFIEFHPLILVTTPYHPCCFVRLHLLPIIVTCDIMRYPWLIIMLYCIV